MSTASCVSCGRGLPPERAEKYDYCTAADCQQQNAKGLAMVAVGVNKAADQYQLLDEGTRADMVTGRYRDQRRGTFGASQPSRPATPPPRAAKPDPGPAAAPARTAAGPARGPAWSAAQQELALIYHARGMRPAEIARQLGVSSYLVSQMILAGKRRRRS